LKTYKKQVPETGRKKKGKMKTIEVQIYKFSELSEVAKQKAIEKMSYVDFDWWDSVYEDAENIGLKISGFDIDRGSYCKGDFMADAEETANKIISEHGEECETFKTAKNYILERDRLVAKYSDGKNIEIVTEYNENDFDNDCDDLDDEFLKSLCEDYRIILSKEYDYLTSDAAIIETIEANDYDFTENGEMY
jgi:hypothetical protein